jgi:hypothetical protein
MALSTTSSETKVKPILGGHETFAFRNGWLKKGVDAARKDPSVFTKEDALVTLGVGKNMVRSIRHWCLAAKLLEETSGTGQARPLQTTWLADSLLAERAWDPYLEKEGSLWLLHWEIATNPVRSLIWNILFSDYLEPEFTKQSLTSFITKQLDYRNVRTTSNMILREIDCCLHTYVTTRTSKKQKSKQDGGLEETLDCPLAELDLIRFMPEYELYHFNVGPKASLPAEVFGYSLLSFIPTIAPHRSTIALEECIYKPGSPGQIFKLDDNSVVDYLEVLEEKLSGNIRLIETAGLSQIYLTDDIVRDIDITGRNLLQSYYE